MSFKRSSLAAASILSICLLGTSAAAADQEAITMKNQTTVSNITDDGAIPPPTVCLIVRSGSNPYFDAMRSSAQRHATKLGLNLIIYVTSESGTVGGYAAADRNIALIQKCVTEDGAIALLLSIAADDPGSDTETVAIEKARVEHGVLALAIDSRINGVDALIQTNNTAAGEAIGQYAMSTSDNKEDERIAVLYCPIEDDPNIYERTVGFISGFGLSTQYTDPTTIDDPNSTRTIDFYSDPQLVAAREYKCSVADSGKVATLDILATNSGDDAPTIIYATNEVGGYGALEAVREKGLSDSIRIMTIDGSCNGVAEAYNGGFDANIIQQPGLMAQIGLDAAKAFLETGKAATGFTDTPFGLAVKEQGYPYATLQTEAEDICWGGVDAATDLSGVGAGAIVGSKDTNGGGGGTVECSIGYVALMLAISLVSIV